MKKKNILRIIISVIVVSLCLFLKNDVQAMTPEEAGKYVAEFAINFFDAHASETTYGVSGRASAYHGQKTSGKYQFDCVGWLSFAVHQATGYGNKDFTEFAVPFHGNPYPGYNNGYKEVYGKGGSSNKIPLDELKAQLKPGDLLMSIGPRKHVLLYVGDNTLIHSTGHGPGEEYGGDKGYGIVKESLDHYYKNWGIEAVGRLTDSAAASINESNCTTIFGQAGAGLTGVWEKASEGGVGVSSAPSNQESSNKFSVEGMNEDLTLGLRYPKDNTNTPLNSFMDFTQPFLQTWMIPLAMNAGILKKIEEEKGDDYIDDPFFGYLTIKEAMSDILVDRYDITKCTLKTKYKVYNTITYEVERDEEGNVKSKKEISRTYVDESSNGPKSETYVGKDIEVNTKYFIKKAYTFDVKINNESTYTKYSDSDVENRVEGGTGYQKTEKENGDSFSEGGDPGGNGKYTYTVKEGHYVNVKRIWEDKLEIGDTKIEKYTIDDVKDYIKSGGVKKPTTASYTQTGAIYNCKAYDLTEEQITRVSEIVYGEYGFGIEGAKNVASQMANLYEKWGTSKSFYEWLTSSEGTRWYGGSSSHTTNDDMKEAVRQCIVEGKRTMPPYVHELVTYSAIDITPFYGSDVSKYIQGETHITQNWGGASGTLWCVDPAPNGVAGGNVFFYDEEYKKKCEESQNFTVTGDGSKSTTTSSVKNLDDFLFLGDGITYGVKETKKISNANFINIVGSTPEHWNKWLNSEQDKFDNGVDFSGKKMPEEGKINGVCAMLGINALNSDASVDQVISDMKGFIDKICSKYSNKPVYIQKVLPVREGDKCSNPDAVNEKIKKFNQEISSYCTSKGALFIDTSNGYVGSDKKLSEDKSKDGVHLKEYGTLANNIINAIVGTNVTDNPVDTEGLEDFDGKDIEYYRLLQADNEINRVDMMNARPENYLRYLKKGKQYSNHVGYPRGYTIFSYSELKRLFDEKFQSKKLPFVYGESLGYEMYKPESYELDAGTVSGTINDDLTLLSRKLERR